MYAHTKKNLGQGECGLFTWFNPDFYLCFSKEAWKILLTFNISLINLFLAPVEVECRTLDHPIILYQDKESNGR